jgi:hypothetical protein
VFVEPLEEYLAGKSANDLDEILHMWESKTGLIPEYKAAVIQRIEALRDLKPKELQLLGD